MKARARELGLTDVDVARRLGLAQGRYSAYVNGTREPDFALFVRICAVLQTTPDVILGVAEPRPDSRPAMTKLMAVASALDDGSVDLAAEIVAVLVGRIGARPARSRRPRPVPRGRTRVD